MKKLSASWKISKFFLSSVLLVMENLVEEKKLSSIAIQCYSKGLQHGKKIYWGSTNSKKNIFGNSRIFRSGFSLREARKINLVIAPLAQIVRRQINVFSQNYAV
jgi:hypothetical protein